ncbi:hypothetical protein N7490_006623 [Penicillium lividum]|nr:hypothetical protein N7490_006623 [Penicillium lividum]
MVKSSNEKRALLKQQCREALSIHIHDRLGLVVAPAQVRLQPPPGDAFLVEIKPEQRDELGRSLEAVSPQVLQGAQSSPTTEARAAAEQTNSDGGSDGSFTAKLHDLECANYNLSLELDRTRTHSVNLLPATASRQSYRSKIRQVAMFTVQVRGF